MWFILPLILTLSFGILAYRNVKQIAYLTYPLVRRELDKQLTVMVLIQVLVNFIALMSNVISYLLILNDSLKANSVVYNRINLAHTISICLFYVSFSVRKLLISYFNFLPLFVLV